MVNSASKQSRKVCYEREPGGDWFRGEIAHFAQCVAEDREPSVTGEDGNRALEIGLAILQSSETGEKAYL